MLELNVVAGGRQGDFGSARHLTVSGSNREIGRAMARAARNVHGAAAEPLPVTDAAVARTRRRWFDLHHPALSERMQGVAEVFGVDPDADRWDLAWLGTYEMSPGCSVVSYPGAGTKDGHGLMSRNFDFPMATFSQLMGVPEVPDARPLAADPWIVEMRPDNGYASITVGIMDVMGAMDGVNEAGLAVALMADDESPNKEPSLRPQVGLSEQQVIRYLLDTCATVDEAREALLMAKQYYMFVPCHYLITDRSGRSMVWEYSAGHNVEHVVESSSEGRMVCTNHLLHRWPDPSELPAEPESFIAGMSYKRWQHLDNLNNSGGIVDRDEVRQQMNSVRFEAPVEGVRTFWQAIYDVDDPSVQISFYEKDIDGVSQFSDVLEFRL